MVSDALFDAMRLDSNEAIPLRNPNATDLGIVLEPLGGYLLLAEGPWKWRSLRHFLQFWAYHRI